MSTGLSLNDIVNVSVTWQSVPVSARNFGALLIVGDSGVLSSTEQVRQYSSLTGVAGDFSITSPEYLAASVFFGQSPQPSLLYIGQVRSGETPLTSVQRLRQNVGAWYAVGFALANNVLTSSDIEAVSSYIEGVSPSSLFLVTTQDSEVLEASSTTDVAATLQASEATRTVVQYSTSSAYAVFSLFGLFATVDYNGYNTVISAKFKQEPGVTAETLTEQEAGVLDGKNVNYLATYQNGSTFLQQGKTSGGRWIDALIGVDAFANALQTNGINTLASLPRVPQTQAGVSMLETSYIQACEQFARNGLIATDQVWQGPTIGTLKTGQTLSSGYYLYSTPLNQQSTSDRAARKAPSMQLCVNLAGSVNSSLLNVTVEG